MKNLIVYSVVLLSLTTVLMLTGNCNQDLISCALNLPAEYYYVKFTMNGPGYTLDTNEITFNFGPPLNVSDPILILVNQNALKISGGSNNEGGEQCAATLSIEGYLSPNSSDEYIGTYGDDVSDIGTCFISFLITEGESGPYFYNSTDETVTITSFGDVGSDVEGTFSCTLEFDSTIAPSFGSPLSVSGDFRLKSIQL